MSQLTFDRAIASRGLFRRLIVLLGAAAMLLAGAVLAPAAQADPPGQIYPSLTPADRSALASFSPPTDVNGTPITDATYEYSLDGGAWRNLDATFDNDTQQYAATITGLQNARSYSVQLRARNADGPGVSSDPVSVSPGVPVAPGFVATTPAEKSATVQFGVPTADGGSSINSYEFSVTTSSVARNWRPAPALTDNGDGSLTGTVTGLTNATTYYVTVRARNANGPGVAFDPPAVVTPGVPTEVFPNPAPGDQSTTVSFGPPTADGGSPITGYDISVTTDDTRDWKPVTDPTDNGDGTFSTTVDGLSNGTPYNVAMRARNANGVGAVGTGQVTPDTVPLQVGGVSLKPSVSNDPSVEGTGTIDVSYTPQTESNGQYPSAPFQYVATATPGGANAVCNDQTNPCQITGLNNGTTYAVTVRATNNTGDGPESEPVDATPLGAPYVFRTLKRVSTTPNSLTISFTSPRNGGSVITRHEVSINGGTWRTAAVRVVGSRKQTTISGLASGRRYGVRVRAVNRLGAGNPSPSLTVLTAPSIVIGKPGVRAGTSAALVQWRASSERDVIGYTVYSSRNKTICVTQTRTETACIVGAEAGKSTNFRVAARSAAGTSYRSAATKTVKASSPYVPSKAPGVPGGFSYHSSKVKSGKKATLTARGFLPGSSVVLVAYGKSRHIVKRLVVSNGVGYFKAVVTMPKDKASRLTFIAYGTTPYGSNKAIGTSIKRG